MGPLQLALQGPVQTQQQWLTANPWARSGSDGGASQYAAYAAARDPKNQTLMTAGGQLPSQGGRGIDRPVQNADGTWSVAYEMTPQERAASGLNNGRNVYTYAPDPKNPGQFIAQGDPRQAEATQNDSQWSHFRDSGILQSAALVAGGLAMAAPAGAAAGSAAAAPEAGALVGSAPAYGGVGTAGAGATGEGLAAGGGSLLGSMTPAQVAQIAQQYGPTAIKALGLIGGAMGASHVANSQQSGLQSGPQVPAWQYQQQPIAPGSAFGGGMFGQQQNPMAAMMQQQRGYQFGSPGQQTPPMPASQQGPFMPQQHPGWGFPGMPQGPSQQAMQQYQQGLFQQHSRPGGFFGFQAPQAMQQQITPQMIQQLLSGGNAAGPNAMQVGTQPSYLSQPRPVMYGGMMGGK